MRVEDGRASPERSRSDRIPIRSTRRLARRPPAAETIDERRVAEDVRLPGEERQPEPGELGPRARVEDRGRRARVIGDADRTDAAARAGIRGGLGIAAAARRARPPEQVTVPADEDQWVTAEALRPLDVDAMAVKIEFAADHSIVLLVGGARQPPRPLQDQVDVLPVALVVVDPLVERVEEPVLNDQHA